MALVTVLKPSIFIVSPRLRLGPTITMSGFKTVTRAILDHAALKNSVIVIMLMLNCNALYCNAGLLYLLNNTKTR